MWVNETIFSEGDLCDIEKYQKFIDDEYEGFYQDRLSHLMKMLSRLEAEKDVLKELMTGEKSYN